MQIVIDLKGINKFSFKDYFSILKEIYCLERRKKIKLSEINRNLEIFKLIKKYSDAMTSQPYTIGKEGRIYIKADGKCYTTTCCADLSNLQQQDIIILKEKEIFQDMKAKVLMQLRNVNALVVSNTPFCEKCSKEGKDIFAVLDDMAQIIGPKAPLVDFNIKDILKALNHGTACIVKDKYTLFTGRNLYEAVVAMLVLEKSAEVFLKAQVLGGGKKINGLEARLMRSIYKRKYSKAEEKVKALEIVYLKEDILLPSIEENEKNIKTANRLNEEKHEIEKVDNHLNNKGGEGDTDSEGFLRMALVEYGKKLLKAGLVQGTWGNISVRLNEEYMLVTPSGRDYNTLTSQDMVKVNIDSLKYEGSLKPTSEKDLHGSIYSARKDIGAVIHTHSKYCCIFAAAEKPMPIIEKNPQNIFGAEISVAGYGLPGTRKLTSNTLAAVGDGYAAIMANHGMICCGGDIKEAFENCQLLEKCGENYIESRYKK